MDLNTSATFWHGIIAYILWVTTISVVPFFVYSERSNKNRGQRDHTMRQVVPYKRLKIMEYYQIIRPKSGCSHLWELIIYGRFYCRVLTGKSLTFWIGGRLIWQVMVSPRGMFDCSQIKKVTEYKRISEGDFIWARKLTFLTRWLLFP